MRRTLIRLACLAAVLVVAPYQAHAQQLKPFKIEGHKIPEIKPPEQPSWKIVKPEPYKVTPPTAPKSYGGEPILKAPDPAREKKAAPAKKAAARKATARKSASRAAPAPRRAVAPRPAPAASASPFGMGRGRGRLFRIR